MLHLLASLAHAAPQVTVQVDPLTALLGFAHVQVEAVLADRASLYVGPSLRLYSAPWGEPEPYRGYGLEAGLRVYPWGEAPKGPYVMTRGVGAWLTTNDGAASNPGAYGSVLAGYQAILGERWVPVRGRRHQRLPVRGRRLRDPRSAARTPHRHRHQAVRLSLK
ncbi:MAG: hypothetical protein GY913_05185 [Proteobacteria bacterium]|nr:hypothetical protein [Pseudomonadota bacterium]MCP4916295.1 hypothetical protein [Pseudomonadota bacterium]